MITNQTKLKVNCSLTLEKQSDDIYIVLLEDKKFALNSTAYFLATNFNGQSFIELIELMMDQFEIDSSKRTEVENDCKKCIEDLIRNNILLISETIGE